MNLRRRPPEPAAPQRADAPIHVQLSVYEARALARAADLVQTTLRPELFRPSTYGTDPPPLITAQQVLVHACELADEDCQLMSVMGAQTRRRTA